MTSDHPIDVAQLGRCTGCQRMYEWRCLQPIVSPQDRMMMLCGVCSFKMDTRTSVSCEGAI